MTTFAPEYVEAPPATPLPYGLLSAALVLDNMDPRSLMAGVHYEPDYCGPALETAAACMGIEDPGEGTLAVDAAGEATLTLTDVPEGLYSVTWPDATITYTDTALGTGVTHDLAPGEQTITVTGPRGWRATVTITVVEDEALAEDAELVLSTDKVTTEGKDAVLGDPFVLYHLFKCKAPAGGYQEGEERARRALGMGEGRAAEAVLARQLAQAAAAVDLTPTPGTGLHPVDAVAALEQWAGENYGGVPVIHSPRGITTRMSAHNLLERNTSASRLETQQGAIVASGGGYGRLLGPTGVEPGAGEAWLYVTGAVVVRRGPIDTVPPSLGRDAGAMTNDFVTLAERGYITTWECITGAILVDASYSEPA